MKIADPTIPLSFQVIKFHHVIFLKKINNKFNVF